VSEGWIDNIHRGRAEQTLTAAVAVQKAGG
jgi:hypothetical protein